MNPNAGGGGSGVSANEYSCAYGAQINFGDLTQPMLETIKERYLLCTIYHILLSSLVLGVVAILPREIYL
jgi:hypothetical protein